MEKDTKSSLDDFCFDISCAVETVGAVHEAMECGDFTAESYLDALYGAYLHLFKLKKELRHLVDELFEEGIEAVEKETKT